MCSESEQKDTGANEGLSKTLRSLLFTELQIFYINNYLLGLSFIFYRNLHSYIPDFNLSYTKLLIRLNSKLDYNSFDLSMVVHNCKPNTQKTEAELLRPTQ